MTSSMAWLPRKREGRAELGHQEGPFFLEVLEQHRESAWLPFRTGHLGETGKLAFISLLY